MQTTLLTPHQFDAIAEHVDTLVVTSHTPFPIDIAAPIAAPGMIAQALSDRLITRFAGRVSGLNLGAEFGGVGPDNGSLQRLCSTWHHPVSFVVVVTDRRLLADIRTVQGGGMHWVLCDWWQWLTHRVEPRRRPDAWMFLCHACDLYFNSPERKRLGLDEETGRAMADEGRRLMEAMEHDLHQHITAMWDRATSQSNTSTIA